MENSRIMIIDDEEIILDSIRDYLEEYNIETFNDSHDALKELRNSYYDIVVADYKMPNLSGLEVLIESKKTNSYYYGILLTAYADKEMLEDFINKNLIKKVIEKPLKLKLLKSVIDAALLECKKQQEKEKEIDILKNWYEKGIHENKYFNHKIIGVSTSLKSIFDKIESISQTNENIFITGETGTGKEVIARAIHSSSRRREKSFIKINCGAIPESLIESELFGYKKGAFTGAYADKKGKIEMADEGTLFLDEIGELKMDMQTRLLHTIQDREIQRLGENKVRKVDFRLISATNRDLIKCIETNLFRKDLFYRINTIPVYLPPLRERESDIKSLVEYLIGLYSKEVDKKNISISEEAINILKQYSWPGNIRELENVIKRAIILLEEDQKIISLNSFDYLFLKEAGNTGILDNALKVISEQIIKEKLPLKILEKRILEQVLDQFEGNIMEASRKTAIPKDRFYRNRA